MLTVLNSFTNSSIGTDPRALIQATDGNFYGVTADGGLGYGTFFRITAAGAITMIYSFSKFTNGNLSDEGIPTDLIQASDGKSSRRAATP